MKNFNSTVPFASHSDKETIISRHKSYLKMYNGDSKDCEVCDLEDVAVSHLGYKTTYLLKVRSYIGWKVYKLHTGCFAYLPGEEHVDGQSE